MEPGELRRGFGDFREHEMGVYDMGMIWPKLL
jgi:hypothetical protein